MYKFKGTFSQEELRASYGGLKGYGTLYGFDLAQWEFPGLRDFSYRLDGDGKTPLRHFGQSKKSSSAYRTLNLLFK